ncbi:MAG: EpsI family protein [bacterium]|nr:EpsI family protein [bacterium]
MDELETRVELGAAERVVGSVGEVAEERDVNRDVYRPLTFLLFALLGGMLVYSYSYPLQRTYQSWGSQHGYNANGLYIFLGACLLIFWQRKRLRALPKTIDYRGLVLVVLGLLWSLAFKRGDINAMQTVGFIGVVWALCLYLGGWLFAKAMMFPLFFSLFSVQWGLASSVVALKMRLWSTAIACWLINVTGKPFGIMVERQGTNVSMPEIPELAFDVAAPCSGLQSLIMTAVLCLLMCYLSLRTWWKRVVMVALIGPIAILNNSLRIMLIAYCGTFFTWIERVMGLQKGWGKDVAYGAFHEYPGIVVYGLGFAMVWLAAHYLERLPGVEREEWEQRKAEKAAARAARARKAEAAAAGLEMPETSDAARQLDRSETSDVPNACEVSCQPVDYRFYGRLWKHVAVALALVIGAHYLGNYAKHRIYYSKGLASGDHIPTLVLGQKGYSMQRLPYVTAFPERIGYRLRVLMPVTELELSELPKDTEYFRGLYVPTNRYAAYARGVQYLFSRAPTSDVAAVASGLGEALGEVVLPTNTLARLAGLSQGFIKWLEEHRYPDSMSMAFGHVMAALAQADRHPENIMLAVVQNKSDQHSIHTPEACFPAQGWTIDEPFVKRIELGGHPADVACLDVGFRQENIRECVLYWYQREGEGVRNIYATGDFFWLPFKTAFNLIFRGRSDRWAFVRLSTVIDDRDPGKFAEGYERLLAFVREVEPYLMY